MEIMSKFKRECLFYLKLNLIKIIEVFLLENIFILEVYIMLKSYKRR